MDELNEMWAKMTLAAEIKAKTEGRADVAEYLALKFANDALRAAACRWLFDSLIALSDEANRRGIKLDIENENPHRFAVGYSTMVGALLKFNYGVRNLTVEAGWTRTPQDGFIKGGGLARARLTHFGINRHNAELLLVRSAEDAPQWFSVTENGARNIFLLDDLRRHFAIFLDAESSDKSGL